MSENSSVKVIVHRGTHQIGGCCTEIATATTRILIDYGANLDVDDNSRLEVDGVTNDTKICDGILISHYHGDHIGELIFNHQSVPVYMTEKSIQIQKLFQTHANGKYMSEIDFDNMKAIYPGITFSVGDIKITPIESEHSAFEPLMFFIEACGKRILHTGDFRMHGLHWKTVQKSLKQFHRPDLVITEGTTLSRKENESFWSEMTVQEQLCTVLKKHKYCFFLASSSNTSRIETFAQSIPRGKYFLMDDFQKDLLQITGSDVFRKSRTYGENLKLEQCGFGMIIRANNYFAPIVRKYLSSHPEETCFIYSMWSGYLEKDSIREIYDLPYKYKYIIHSSGHVVYEDLNTFFNELDAHKIVFIHTDASVFHFDLNDRIISIKDKEVLTI